MKTALRYVLVAFTLVAILVTTSGVTAVPTTKNLSTTYTVANLGSDEATVVVNYYKDGGDWAASADSTSFTLAANGGQKQIRQYTDSTMTSGQGSAVISSDQPLAAITLILARGQTPTSGGYNGITEGSTSYNIPQIMKIVTTGSGLASSQLVIQNLDTKDIFVSVSFVPAPGSSFSPATKTFTTPLKAGNSQYYNIDTEPLLTNGWSGSAVVSAKDGTNANALIGVVSNLFVGPDLLYTSKGFSSSELNPKWYVPYFTSKNSNGQNTSVTVQNLSGGDLTANELLMVCTKDPAASGPTTLTMDNGSTVVPNNGSFTFNALTLPTAVSPANWYGSCVVTTSGGTKNLATVVFVRHVNNPNNGGGAAFEGIPAPSTGNVDKYKEIAIPYINKVGSNGVATVVNIQNLGSVDSTVYLTYTASVENTAGPATVTVGPFTIPAGGSMLRNHRNITSNPVSEPGLPAGWFGSLKITSDQPTQAYVFVTNAYNAIGDTYFGFIGFPRP